MTEKGNQITLSTGGEYYLDAAGTVYPRVSTILKATGISTGYDAVPPDILAAAARRGTAVHQLCERYDRGQDIDWFAVGDDEAAMTEAYIEWRKTSGFTPALIEATMCHRSLLYGGTIDRVGILDGVPTLIDLKTSSRIMPHTEVQMAAYVLLCRDNGVEVAERRVLQLKKDGTARLHQPYADDGALRAWWTAVMLYREWHMRMLKVAAPEENGGEDDSRS